MEEKAPNAEATHLRWQTVDEESGDTERPRLNRLNRSASYSSQSSGRNLKARTTVDPSLSLPIHYRTVYVYNFPNLYMTLFTMAKQNGKFL